MTSFEDGINADHQAMDYRKQEQSLKKGDHITVRLARNVDSLRSFANHIHTYLLRTNTFLRIRSRYKANCKPTTKEIYCKY